MKFIFSALPAVILTACIASVFLALPSHAGEGPYRSPKGFELTPPAGWIITHPEGGKIEVVFSAQPDDGFVPDLLVVVADVPSRFLVPGKNNLPLLEPSMIQEMGKDYADFHLVRRETGAIDGLPAFEVAATAATHTTSLPLALYQVVAMRSKRLYMFVVALPADDQSRYRSAFNQMIRSIRWTTATS